MMDDMWANRLKEKVPQQRKAKEKRDECIKHDFLLHSCLLGMNVWQFLKNFGI